ncbi:MAG: DUF7109 family protein [Halolamina sp.]
MEEATHDELAGVVDLFDALTRDELVQALVELAFRRGRDVRAEVVDEAVAEAVREYYLVALPADAVEGDVEADEALTVGPVAFPTLPAEGEDLPHILDVPSRTVDRAAAAEQVTASLREAAESVIEAGDDARARTLVDVTYDAEAWGSVDLTETRDRLLALVD